MDSRVLSPEATLLRDSEGSLFLTTKSVLIVDILRRTDWEPVIGGFAALLRARSQQSRQEDPTSTERYEQVIAKHGIGARVYAIRPGIRIMVTSRLYDPESPEAKSLIADLNAEPPTSNEFRVNLTPDTAKLGPAPFDEEPLTEWLFLCPYSNAQFIRALGPREIITEAQDVIDAHDRYTQALTRRPLPLADA